jgi:2,3,4,5-tetrahydropyridine-2-carboxylate N-succinyltransferase/tetrahydrodipicolinate N-acetyltransferase
VNDKQLRQLKEWVGRFWLLSPERLWLLSIRMHRRGHWVLAFWIKQLNTLLYHNSLAPGATVSPDIYLGHNSIGIVISDDVEIGRGVAIWHNVTLMEGRRRPRRAAADSDGATDTSGPPASTSVVRGRIVVEDWVRIGANAVIIPPRGGTLRIGRAALIGAGAVITEDVPAHATVVSHPPRVLLREQPESAAAREGEP